MLALPRYFGVIAIVSAAFGVAIRTMAPRVLRDIESEQEAAFASARSIGALRLNYVRARSLAEPFSRMTVSHARRMVIYQLLGVAIALHALTQGMSAFWTMALSVSAAAPVLIGVRHYLATTALRRLAKAGRLKAPRPALEERLRAMVGEVADRMSLDVEFKFWVAIENGSLFPSVTEERGLAHVVLPLGFLTIVRKHPERAQAMLAHELGHVDQGDTHLWYFAESAGRWSQVAVVTSCFVQAIGGVVVFGIWWRCVPALVLASNAVVFMQVTRRGRRISERIADVSAVLHADGRAYFDALYEYSAFEDSDAHGPRSARLDRVAQLNRCVEGYRQ